MANIFAIEGPAAVPEGEIRPRRIEIDLSTGLTRRVSAPEGRADLVLGAGAVVFPGLVDFHVHAREDSTGRDIYKEDFESCGAAAIQGGVTAIVDMPNNPRPPIDDESYRAKLELAARAPLDVLLYAGIGPSTNPLRRAVPYKVYMGPSIGDLFFESEGALREALGRYRGRWVSFHSESPEVLRECKDRPTHAERRPAEAEVRAVELALRLAGEIGFEPHICHLSTAGGLEAIRAARRRGIPATCEVAQHHLFFSLDTVEKEPRPGFFQCNPPIRPREDQRALLEAFRRGEIDFLASDHAPHSLAENERGISGIPHLDTSGPFLFWLRAQGASWEMLRRAAAERPGAAFSRFSGEKRGRIEEGHVGSFTILDTTRPITIRRSMLKTRAGWSPFEGHTFSGRVSHTIVRGRVHEPAAE